MEWMSWVDRLWKLPIFLNGFAAVQTSKSLGGYTVEVGFTDHHGFLHLLWSSKLHFSREVYVTMPIKAICLTDLKHSVEFCSKVVILTYSCSNLQSCEKYRILYFHCFFNPLPYLKLVQWLPAFIFKYVSLRWIMSSILLVLNLRN